jgi:alpha-glucosidase
MKPLLAPESLHVTETGIEVRFASGHVLRLMVLGPRLIRVLCLRRGALRLGRTWAIDPDGETPIHGRDRLSTQGFPGAPFRADMGAGVLETADLRVTIRAPLSLHWQARIDSDWVTFAEDRPDFAVMIGVADHAHAHFRRHRAGDRHFGLGEKAGALERTGRRFEMRGVDAMGYDAETTDPLYKHIPFLLTRTETSGWFSVFYDNAAPIWVDVAQEIDNYHPRAVAMRASDGDLDYYMRWSETPAELIVEQTRLTGGVAFAPKWSLGYLGSTMQYTDAEDAQARLRGFLAACAVHDIPCDGFHLSSGYTAIGAKRYVFHWHPARISDPEGLATAFAAAGCHLIANIKPCLLHDHPRYAKAAEAGLFIRDSESDAPERSIFWDAPGSHLDFTNSDTQAWWQTQVRDTLLARGITATWNDNNEFEVWDRGARCAGFGQEMPVDLVRPVQAHLMLRASKAAQVAHAPGLRPYLITRAGGPGLQAHGQTWTGDNFTDWKTLRWNTRMGLGLALSGISNIGHDVGGFAGPRPEAELLMRWVQNGVLHPRFCIHSWNADGSVTEPWTHPEALPAIRAAIALRYRLLPYLYTCLWAAHRHAAPMIAPPFVHFPEDGALLAEGDDFMLGPDLLVASVVEEGARTRPVRLPAWPGGWWDFHTGAWHAGGQWVTLDAPLDRCPLLVRGGAVLALSDRIAAVCGPAPVSPLRLHAFPMKGAGAHDSLLFDDGGLSTDWQADHSVTRFALVSSPRHLTLTRHHDGPRTGPMIHPEIVLPASEARGLTVNG